MAGAGAVAALVGGAGAVGDVDPPTLRQEPCGEQDAGDGFAAAAFADDQRQGGLELGVVGVGVEALERAAGVGGAEDQPAGQPQRLEVNATQCAMLRCA